MLVLEETSVALCYLVQVVIILPHQILYVCENRLVYFPDVGELDLLRMGHKYSWQRDIL